MIPSIGSTSPKLTAPNLPSDSPQAQFLPPSKDDPNHNTARQPEYRKISTTCDSDQLVKEGNIILSKIEKTMNDLPVNTMNIWLKEIKRLKFQSTERNGPMIAIVGATGAGKSSLINCLLGSIPVLPTDGHKACTSVVTEVSLNNVSNGPPHTAEIEFISIKEWETELQSLLEELCDENGLMNADLAKKSSDARTSLCKIKAVYPDFDVNNSVQADIEQLIKVPDILQVLGTKMHFEAYTPEELQAAISRYVESELAEADTTDSSSNTFVYWPLIRKVHIRTKAPILETGCTLVDLPGTGDNNEARSSVAASYLQYCTALWIVSPIIRAASDGHAKDLLGEAFRRQMFRDGTLDRLTFICSKIDDIKVKEIRSRSRNDKEFQELMRSLDSQKAKASSEIAKLEKILSDCQRRKRKSESKLQLAKAMQKAYNKIEMQISAGEVKYPLTRVNHKKRKDGASKHDENSHKRLKSSKGQLSVEPTPKTSQQVNSRFKDSPSHTSDPDFQYNFQQNLNQTPLTINDCEKMLQELGEDIIKIGTEVDRFKKDHGMYRDESEMLRETHTQCKRKEWLACVAQRNRSSVDKIERTFMTDFQDFGNAEPARNVVNVSAFSGTIGDEHSQSRHLPVYCVSSKGYEILKARQIPGVRDTADDTLFTDAADTGIPELIQHARQIGSAQLQETANEYINDVNRLLTSLRIWAGDVFSDSFEETKSMVQETGEMNDMIVNFISSFRNELDIVSKLIKNDLVPRIVDRLSLSSRYAASGVKSLYETWGEKNWSTYRAIVRRKGRYAKNGKEIDFHDELLHLFTRNLDRVWNHVLNDRIPKAMDECSDNVTAMTIRFTKQFRPKLISRGISDASIDLFEAQAKRFTSSFQAKIRIYKSSLEGGQRLISRRFAPIIRRHMIPIYHIIEAETGYKCFDRMREHMRRHMEEHKEEMFDDLHNSSAKALESEESKAHEFFLDEVIRSSTAFQNDCTVLTAQRTVCEFSDLSDDEQTAISELLRKINSSFGTTTGRDGIEQWKDENPDIMSNFEFTDDREGEESEFADFDMVDLCSNDDDDDDDS